MCGFFAFHTGLSPLQIAKELNLTNIPKSFEDLEAIKFAPTTTIPTVSKNSPNQLVPRYWSLIPRWWKDDPFKVPFSTFNARAEDIDQKATYRTPWKKSQRCLIPVSWFYEFATVEVEGQKRPKKVPYRVETSEPLFTLAGLYEVWQDDQRTIESVTIITTEAIPPLRHVHKRQPVIIDAQDRERWLTTETSPEEAQKLLVPSEDLKVSRISQEFNKARGLMIPIELAIPIKE